MAGALDKCTAVRLHSAIFKSASLGLVIVFGWTVQIFVTAMNNKVHGSYGRV